MKKSVKTAVVLTMALSFVVAMAPVQAQALVQRGPVTMRQQKDGIKTKDIHSEKETKDVKLVTGSAISIEKKNVEKKNKNDVKTASGSAITKGKNVKAATGSAITTIITLNKKEATVKLGKTVRIKATVKTMKAVKANENKKGKTKKVEWTKRNNVKLVWTSSDKKIATVTKNGVVKGKAEGSVEIKAATKDGKYKAVCKVTVE